MVFLFKIIWPIAIIFCFVTQSSISPADGLIATILHLPLGIFAFLAPGNWNMTYVFAAIATLSFAFVEFLPIMRELRIQRMQERLKKLKRAQNKLEARKKKTRR
jgi:hypothetical protein